MSKNQIIDTQILHYVEFFKQNMPYVVKGLLHHLLYLNLMHKSARQVKYTWIL